jgi:NADPH2:quinone reductase
MRAIGAIRHFAVDHPDFLVEFESPVPVVGGHDLLVRLRAVAVNPVDTKVRRALADGPHDPPRVLGWDGAGVVEAVGPQARCFFAPGDEVFFAGDLGRAGCNAELVCVDARVAARMPASRDFVAAAALPLCTLTAWELLFERMRVPAGERAAAGSGPLLVINGAGGVASALVPLACHAGLEVVATASRRQSIEWARRLGATVIIDHHNPLRAQIEAHGFREFPWIANLHDPATHWDQTADLLAPFGVLGLVVEPSGPLALGDPLKAKCASIVWEFMPARTRFRTPDVARQGQILEQAAALHDAGVLPPVHTRVLHGLSVENLRLAHREMEAGTAVGKWVIEL